MDKFKNKFRIPSARAQFWDYGYAALYFITICTQNRLCWFGEIKREHNSVPFMALSEIGKIVHAEWLKTFELRPDMNLYMGEFVVMPNHFHAIIGIGPNEYNMHRGNDDGGGRDAMHCVSTGTDIKPDINTKNHFGAQSKNLASIVRGFKSSVTIASRIITPDFQWQSRFHDHIIRNEKSFQTISNYIINNPAKWQEDSLYK